MLNFKYMHAALAAVAFAVLILAAGRNSQQHVRAVDLDVSISDNGVGPGLTLPSPDSSSTFYSVRQDFRRCASPLCGGYFVKRVNVAQTRCADGRYMKECYVAEIDWNAQPQVEARRALVRGDIIAKRYGHFGNLGALRVAGSWQAASDRVPRGTFFRVRDRNVRCITFPCPTHHEAKLNSTFARNIAGVDLSSAGAGENLVSEAHAAMTGPGGVLVAGDHVGVTGPGGRSQTLEATQFYLRAGNQPITDPPATKPPANRPPVGKLPAGEPCRKTGCSNQVCSDEPVITTCEWRPEYACYQKARCERQRDGKCGFTRTPELTECLARIR